MCGVRDYDLELYTNNVNMWMDKECDLQSADTLCKSLPLEPEQPHYLSVSKQQNCPIYNHSCCSIRQTFLP